MIDNNWIEDLLKKSKLNTEKEEKDHNNPLESKLIARLIDECYKIHKEAPCIPLGIILASTFDLVVAADYYSYVGHKGWYYCPTPTPSLYYHFTNCCPRHALDNIFHFHSASKPESGSIGKSTYWLTNGCGSPNPKPAWWPKSKGGDGVGFESISDSKTSVGMDRTDDIKKGIYQVLKLGSEGKLVSSKWNFKVGIVPNIHAARHFEEYLESLKNLIWTRDATGKAKKAGDLKPEHPLYNLFDGIIALTACHFRDEWLKQVFGLEDH